MPFPTLHPFLAQALTDKGYAEPTPVQAAVLESGAEGRDLLVSAQTGSGKTVAYGLALGPTLMGETGALPRAAAPLALIIAPTRELALQVERELHWLYAPAGAQVAVCVGGMDPRREQRVLERGAHIVVATPGRLRDHLERGNIDTSVLRAVVLDEADEMLDLGFREDLEFILDATPAQRRTLMFSATLARDIVALARTYQNDAVRIDTIQAEVHSDIEYRAFLTAPNEVELATVNVLRFFDARSAIVFCHTREAVRHLHSNLLERGFGAVALSGELSQNERSLALQSLRDGRARVLVATDVAARGLDLPDLGLVIHFDLPQNRAALLHRSGRTGRAGRKGVSVLMVPYTRRRKAEMVLGNAGVEAAWSGPPAAEEIRKQDQQRLLSDPVLTEENSEEDLALAAALLEQANAQDIAAALVRLYRARLPAPEELFDGGAYLREPREKNSRERRTDNAERPKDDWNRDRREAREGASDGVWFRLNIGREKNADPKWLIPLICRRGHVTKPDIGAIRIFGRETKFEIVKAAADRFTQAVQGAHDDGVKIEPAGAPDARDRGDRGPAERGPRPKFEGKKFDGPAKPRGDKFEGKTFDGPPKPRGDKFDGPKNFGDKPPYKARPEGAAPPRDKPYVRPAPEGAERPQPRRDWSPATDGEAAFGAEKPREFKKKPFNKGAGGKPKGGSNKPFRKKPAF